MAEEEVNGYSSSLMDRNVPSQLDEDDLKAELEIELPDSQNNVMAMVEAENVGEIEINETDDGGVEIDFDPQDQRGVDDDFYANLAEEMPDRELQRVASELLSEYDANKASRQDWEDAYSSGLELLGFNYEERTQPFRGSSGVTHPLLAEAATQFQAQAFNELLPSSGPVRTVVMGQETRAKAAQSQRVRQFMNYYITNVMEDYTPDMDQMLFYLPLAGSTFKKTYYDEALGRAVSKFVPAENLVVPYETADLETCPNITQVVRMSLNDLRKRQIAGVYLDDVDVIPSQREVTGVEGEIDRIDGIEPGSIDYDCTILECHVDLDLEGYEEVDDDGEPTGIRVPYIVTLSMDNGQVLAVRRNWDEEDTLKKKIQYFTHYKFLPGFGFYGLGLIHTIGGLSRTATSALRQLIDAGTLSNLPAGFKARGLRIRDDDEPLQPGEFRDVDAPGGAIRDSLMPLPFKGPDQTLFQLLGFVVQAGQRFATITDLKVGDGNQQAAVGTTMAMMEQGSRVMSAVHKRLHYAMRQEFRILARVMSESLPQEYPYSVPGGDETIMREDFDGRVDVIPVSNPNVFSQSQRIMLAQTKLQLASQAPEIHNMHEVFSDMYDALGVTDTDRLLKSVPADTDEPVDPAQENINALDMLPLKAFEGQNHQAHITAHLLFGTSPIVGGMPPVAIAVQKHVMEHVQIAAREQAAVAYLQQVQQQGGQPADEEQMLQVEQMTAQFIAEGLQQLKDLSGQLSGAGAPDPLVQLKEQELQQKAAADQADTQIDQAKLELDAQNQQMRGQQFQQRLQSQEEQTAARIQSAMEREILKQRGAGAMMNKSLNYAYPRKYAEGGEVPQVNTFVRDGVEMVENNGQMVPKEALAALQMTVGLNDQDLRYDANNDGEIGIADALAFIKYAKQENYDDSSDFMSQFYGQGAAAENPTYTDQVPGYTEGGVEFQGPDMPPPLPEGVATTRMVGEEEGMDGLPPPGMATTMAMGEEDGGGGVIEPDLPRPPNPFLDLKPPMATTQAMGEEDGGLPIPEKPVGDLTTMAVGEEDGGGAFPLPPPSQTDPPMFQPVTPPPNTGYTPPPVVAPEFAPLPVAPGLPQGGSQGRTYGAYSQAGQQAGNTLQPFTPYTPPQQNEGIRSLIDEPVSYLTESGPRSSVFRRS